MRSRTSTIVLLVVLIGTITVAAVAAVATVTPVTMTMTMTMTNQSDSTVASGPWSEILEEWILLGPNSSNDLRNGRVTKIQAEGFTITPSDKGMAGSKRDVSETDLYLLGAIEKLVYRADYLEKRLRRVEELLYYVISNGSNDVEKVEDSCPANYTRIGGNCYYFSERSFDWKSSASLCRGIAGRLVEFESIEESQDVVTSLQESKKLRGKNFWTGGLNPGLLWIWATSGRPVHRDTQQTVVGQGRCLKLGYNTNSKIYGYEGEDCGTKQRYICELTKNDKSANKIEKTVRSLEINMKD